MPMCVSGFIRRQSRIMMRSIIVLFSALALALSDSSVGAIVAVLVSGISGMVNGRTEETS
jgi:hypothetical protein